MGKKAVHRTGWICLDKTLINKQHNATGVPSITISRDVSYVAHHWSMRNGQVMEYFVTLPRTKSVLEVADKFCLDLRNHHYWLLADKERISFLPY